MKNGKLELFDDVIFDDGGEKGQIRYIEPTDDDFRFFVAFDDGDYGWCLAEQLTYLPKQPVMVYVSDKSEEDAINRSEPRKLIYDRGAEYDKRFVVEMQLSTDAISYRYIVPVDRIKPTITRAELQQAQDLLEKVKNGAVVIEGEASE